LCNAGGVFKDFDFDVRGSVFPKLTKMVLSTEIIENDVENIEIPLTISIVSGQDEQKADEEIFGKFPIEGKPHMFRMGNEKEIEKLRKDFEKK